MISPIKAKNSVITKVVRNKNTVTLFSERETMRLSVYDKDIVRVSVTHNPDGSFEKEQGEEFLPGLPDVPFSVDESENEITIKTELLAAKVTRRFGSVSFYKNENPLFSEAIENPHVIEKFDSYKTAGNIKIEEIQTADGLKKRVTAADKIFDKTLNHTTVNFNFSAGEKLYGLGQAEEGVWNLRGTTQYLHQANKKIAIPFLVSSLGYGLIFTTQSPAIFSDTAYGSYFYTTADYYLDYFFVAPKSKNLITAKMRQLTGKALKLPDWAFGYIQSQERYETQEEILQTVAQFKDHDIPLSTIVLDWLSWEDGMWGQKSFDQKRFPDVTKMVDELHKQNVRFMISIWPSMDEKCANYKEMKEKDCLLPGINICNVFEKKGRELYWEQTRQGLAKHGIDAWWCDSSEPVTPEWNHVEKQTPENMFSEFVKAASDIMPIEKANAYGFYHSKGLYEGSIRDYPERPVVNLTRNGYLGSQKYGVILWSGDISAKWSVLQNQVVAANQMALSGLPYWTLDIGGFFVKKGIHWYWDGDYDDTTSNAGFKELYTRWLQFATFLPIFRAHGTDCRREPWAFMDDSNLFYDVIVKFIKLRYEFLPYIKEVEEAVCNNDEMILRPLFTAFNDKNCEDISTQFMFGPKYMVCPVTKPMYFDNEGNALNTEKFWDVYLPSDCDWTDYWTGKTEKGGRWIKASAEIDKIPLFIRGAQN